MGERWLTTGCFRKEVMSRSDLRGGGVYVVCVCVCGNKKCFQPALQSVAVCFFVWPFDSHFFFLCFVLLVERRVQTHLCRFFVFCVLVEIIEEPDLCPVQN